MLATTQINFDKLFDTDFDDIYAEHVLMFDSLTDEELHQIIVEGIIPEKLKAKASHIINKWAKIDPNKKLAEIENKLKQQGVGALKFKSIATKHAKSAGRELKPHLKDPKKMALVIKKHYRAAEIEVNELSQAEKWGVSVLMLVAILILNTFIINILSLICALLGLSPLIGFALGAIFIAPITEETAKFISIKKKATGQFFTTFNLAEFSMYIASLTSAGVPLLTAVLGRLLAVSMHGATTYVQWRHRKSGEEKGEVDDKTAKKGLAIGMVIHSMWNFLGTLAMW